MSELWSTWQGGLVRLRAIQPDDAAAFVANEGDSETERNGGWLWPPRGLARTRKWIEERTEKAREEATAFLAIETLDSGEMAGMISTRDLVARHGTFEYGITLWRPHWQKGYGSEALKLLFRYYFNELRFEKVNAGVWAYNDRSIAFHRAFGFKEEARLRSMIVTNGRRHDELRFGMLASEFREHHAAWLTAWSGQ